MRGRRRRCVGAASCGCACPARAPLRASASLLPPLLALLAAAATLAPADALRAEGGMETRFTAGVDVVRLGGEAAIFGFSPNGPSELVLTLDSAFGTPDLPTSVQQGTEENGSGQGDQASNSSSTTPASSDAPTTTTAETSSSQPAATSIAPVACAGVSLCDVSKNIVRGFYFTRKQRRLSIRPRNLPTRLPDVMKRTAANAACSSPPTSATDGTGDDGARTENGKPPAVQVSLNRAFGCTHFLIPPDASVRYTLRFANPESLEQPPSSAVVQGRVAKGSNQVEYTADVELPNAEGVSAGHGGGRIFQLSLATCWCAAARAVKADNSSEPSAADAGGSTQGEGGEDEEKPVLLTPLRALTRTSNSTSRVTGGVIPVRLTFSTHMRNTAATFEELGWEEEFFPIGSLTVIGIALSVLVLYAATAPAVLRLRHLETPRVLLFGIAALFFKVCSTAFIVGYFYGIANTGFARRALAISRIPIMLIADLLTAAFITLVCVGDGVVPKSWRKDGRSPPVQAAAAVFFQFTVVLGVKAVGPHLQVLTGILYAFAGGAIAALNITGSLRMITFLKHYASAVFRSFVRPGSTPLFSAACLFASCLFLIPVAFIVNGAFLIITDFRFGRPDVLWLALEGVDVFLIAFFLLFIFPRRRFLMYSDLSLTNDTRLAAATAWRMRQARAAQAALRENLAEANAAAAAAADTAPSAPGAGAESASPPSPPEPQSSAQSISGEPRSAEAGAEGRGGDDTGASAAGAPPVSDAVGGATADIAATVRATTVAGAATAALESSSDPQEPAQPAVADRGRLGSRRISVGEATAARLRRGRSSLRIGRDQVLRRIEQMTSGAQVDRPDRPVRSNDAGAGEPVGNGVGSRVGLGHRVGLGNRFRGRAARGDVEAATSQLGGPAIAGSRAARAAVEADDASSDGSEGGNVLIRARRGGRGGRRGLRLAGDEAAAAPDPFPMRAFPEPRWIVWRPRFSLPEEFIEWEPGVVPLPTPTRAMWGGFIQVAQAMATTRRSLTGRRLAREPPCLLIGLPCDGPDKKSVMLAVAEPQFGPGAVLPRKRRKERTESDAERKAGESENQTRGGRESVEAETGSAPGGTQARSSSTRRQSPSTDPAGSRQGFSSILHRGQVEEDERSVESSQVSDDGEIFR